MQARSRIAIAGVASMALIGLAASGASGLRSADDDGDEVPLAPYATPEVTTFAAVPVNNAAAGLVYDGLVVNNFDSCAAFTDATTGMCTHGPDAMPVGVAGVGPNVTAPVKVTSANTSASGRSIATTISGNFAPGSYSTTVWIRSASATPVTGDLRLSGSGGMSESVLTHYTVADTWTPVTVVLDSSTPHTVLKLESIMRTTGVNYYYDTASL